MQYFFFPSRLLAPKYWDYEPRPKVVIFNQYLFQSASHKVTVRPVYLFLQAADVLASPFEFFLPPPPPLGLPQGTNLREAFILCSYMVRTGEAQFPGLIEPRPRGVSLPALSKMALYAGNSQNLAPPQTLFNFYCRLEKQLFGPVKCRRQGSSGSTALKEDFYISSFLQPWGNGTTLL